MGFIRFALHGLIESSTMAANIEQLLTTILYIVFFLGVQFLSIGFAIKELFRRFTMNNAEIKNLLISITISFIIMSVLSSSTPYIEHESITILVFSLLANIIAYTIALPHIRKYIGKNTI